VDLSFLKPEELANGEILEVSVENQLIVPASQMKQLIMGLIEISLESGILKGEEKIADIIKNDPKKK
jgi:hypothetical protein